MHRRCLSLAHNADFEEIKDIKMRAKLEARNLLMGRDLILRSSEIAECEQLLNMARDFSKKELL